TGITQNMIEKEGIPFELFKQEIEEIYKYCEKPSFIAFNGNSFDHKIMNYKNIFQNNETLLDSKSIINALTKDKLFNMKLKDIYYNIFNKNIEKDTSKSKQDVKMMKEILKHFKYKKI